MNKEEKLSQNEPQNQNGFIEMAKEMPSFEEKMANKEADEKLDKAKLEAIDTIATAGLPDAYCREKYGCGIDEYILNGTSSCWKNEAVSRIIYREHNGLYKNLEGVYSVIMNEDEDGPNSFVIHDMEKNGESLPWVEVMTKKEYFDKQDEYQVNGKADEFYDEYVTKIFVKRRPEDVQDMVKAMKELVANIRNATAQKLGEISGSFSNRYNQILAEAQDKQNQTPELEQIIEETKKREQEKFLTPASVEYAKNYKDIYPEAIDDPEVAHRIAEATNLYERTYVNNQSSLEEFKSANQDDDYLVVEEHPEYPPRNQLTSFTDPRDKAMAEALGGIGLAFRDEDKVTRNEYFGHTLSSKLAREKVDQVIGDQREAIDKKIQNMEEVAKEIKELCSREFLEKATECIAKDLEANLELIPEEKRMSLFLDVAQSIKNIETAQEYCDIKNEDLRMSTGALHFGPIEKGRKIPELIAVGGDEESLEKLRQKELAKIRENKIQENTDDVEIFNFRGEQKHKKRFYSETCNLPENILKIEQPGIITLLRYTLEDDAVNLVDSYIPEESEELDGPEEFDGE